MNIMPPPGLQPAIPAPRAFIFTMTTNDENADLK